jgi:hypothetical protein
MGQWAVEYLVNQAGNGYLGAPVQHRIACPYIQRESV